MTIGLVRSYAQNSHDFDHTRILGIWIRPSTFIAPIKVAGGSSLSRKVQDPDFFFTKAQEYVPEKSERALFPNWPIEFRNSSEGF